MINLTNPLATTINRQIDIDQEWAYVFMSRISG